MTSSSSSEDILASIYKELITTFTNTSNDGTLRPNMVESLALSFYSFLFSLKFTVGKNREYFKFMNILLTLNAGSATRYSNSNFQRWAKCSVRAPDSTYNIYTTVNPSHSAKPSFETSSKVEFKARIAIGLLTRVVRKVWSTRGLRKEPIHTLQANSLHNHYICNGRSLLLRNSEEDQAYGEAAGRDQLRPPSYWSSKHYSVSRLRSLILDNNTNTIRNEPVLDQTEKSLTSAPER